MKRFAVIAFLFAFSGCTQQQIDKAQSAIASEAPKVANDGLIYATIEAKFASIDATSALHVAVSAHDGIVRLTGRVRNGDIEKRYVAAASQVSGVAHVNATMTVDRNLPDANKQVGDFALATAVRANLTAQVGVNGIALGIGAKGGIVTLDGHVKTGALHKTIVSVARDTAGVKSVVDRLHDDS